MIWNCLIFCCCLPNWLAKCIIMKIARYLYKTCFEKFQINTTFIEIHDLFCIFCWPADNVHRIDILQNSSIGCSWKIFGSTNLFSVIDNYIISVLGCPNLPVIPSLQMSRSAHRATVTCPNTDRSWTLTCQGNKWIGGYGNCTAAIQPPG